MSKLYVQKKPEKKEFITLHLSKIDFYFSFVESIPTTMRSVLIVIVNEIRGDYNQATDDAVESISFPEKSLFKSTKIDGALSRNDCDISENRCDLRWFLILL